MKSHTELWRDAFGKVIVAFLSAAALFFVAFSWGAATGENLIAEVESGFSVKALKLTLAAATAFVIIAFIVSFGSDPDGRRKQRAAALALEYIDDVGGVFASAGGIATFISLHGRGSLFAIWGLGLLASAVLIKFICSLKLQQVAPR